ncbi:hypothetical protein PAXRUDRAFT_730651 [Paxillus rubicundulus Ve08.2h10]|uniref:Uncharacterized protein n=1 Tax=Paxillus rubicundulus Ve08.2h10 TaxID=930991 RepID=A0A0D0DCU6_9AGAM|nr:hypothetical protein PAXRUDRAFT_730651 [Paxillus rubicundulus Ve08.2h10]
MTHDFQRCSAVPESARRLCQITPRNNSKLPLLIHLLRHNFPVDLHSSFPNIRRTNTVTLSRPHTAIQYLTFTPIPHHKCHITLLDPRRLIHTSLTMKIRPTISVLIHTPPHWHETPSN